jgi:hypothetical protein
MAIELSNIIFTDQDDIVTGQNIINTSITNTLAGNDLISGLTNSFNSSSYGFENRGILNTDDGDDTIIGAGHNGILLSGSSSTIETGNGNDMILGTGGSVGLTIEDTNILNTDDGNDVISVDAYTAILNKGIINTGSGEDGIFSEVFGSFSNWGEVFLGEGNDTLFIKTHVFNDAINNFNLIDTGDGDDIITSYGYIYNEGIISTGNGNDYISATGGFDPNGDGYGIFNNGGTIDMGDGNDTITSSFLNINGGSIVLGDGDDCVLAYGQGDFYGGNGNDILQLGEGYTIEIGDTSVNFIYKNGWTYSIRAFDFEQLRVGTTIYDFCSLTASQII